MDPVFHNLVVPNLTKLSFAGRMRRFDVRVTLRFVSAVMISTGCAEQTGKRSLGFESIVTVGSCSHVAPFSPPRAPPPNPPRPLPAIVAKSADSRSLRRGGLAPQTFNLCSNLKKNASQLALTHTAETQRIIVCCRMCRIFRFYVGIASRYLGSFDL